MWPMEVPISYTREIYSENGCYCLYKLQYIKALLLQKIKVRT